MSLHVGAVSSDRDHCRYPNWPNSYATSDTVNVYLVDLVWVLGANVWSQNINKNKEISKQRWRHRDGEHSV